MKIDTNEMQENISDLLTEMKQRKKNSIVEIASDGKAYRVNMKNIIYIYRKKRGSVFVIESSNKGKKIACKEIPSNEKLESWYQQLSEEGFEFAHKSYIVNMQKIISIEKDEILMSNQQLLRNSRTYKKIFQEKFAHYFSKKYRRSTDER